MKKFYKMVSVASGHGGWTIDLDGKPVLTPLRASLIAPAKALADEIAAEWAAQGARIDPETMPLTQILTTLQDHIAVQRETMSGKLLKYLDTDLLCYRAEIPEELAARQAACWDEWLEWFASTYGISLQTTTGLAALSQPESSLAKVRKTIEDMSDARFCALQLVTALSGSLVLGLAFTVGAATPAHVFEAANVEELYKFEIYNEREHGVAPLQEKKQAAMKRDLEAARKFLKLLS